MTQTNFSLDHRLAEIRQAGDDLRAARQQQAYRDSLPETRPATSGSIRTFLSDLHAQARPSRLAAH